MVVGGRELIDTLWNVNYSVCEVMSNLTFELIDTLWNVNPDTLKPVCSAILRINRYIMECKLISFLVIFPGSPPN